MLYKLILSVHIISIIAWMAGMLYLPRLFVYHSQAPNQEASDMLALMEKRLLKIIMNPAIVITWFSGLYLAMMTGAFIQGWFHIKLTIVILMSITHALFGRWRKQLEKNQSKKSQKFFKIVNEIPSLFIIIIVLLVIFKPF